MFRGRKKLQRRDHEAGLAFSWRVPVSSGGSFFAALVLVSLLAFVLAAVVRVTIGNPVAEEGKRGTLVIVPRDSGGEWMERHAIESGPFPVRWNPAADPEYAAIRRQALRAASNVGIPYEPQLVDVEPPSIGNDSLNRSLNADLPELPPMARVVADGLPREVTVGARVIQEKGAVTFQTAKLSLDAAEAADAAGWRYLIHYDRLGRVLDVTALASRGRKDALLSWLARGRVVEHGDQAGAVVVESVIKP